MFKIILTIGTIQVLAIAVNFVRTKLVAVLLGPEGVGIVSTIDQVVQSAAYFSALSLPFASIKFLSKAHSESDEAFKRTYASFLNALLILSATGTVIATGIVLFRPQLLGQEALKYRALLFVALFGICATILGGLFTQVFAAAQKFKYSSMLAVITGVATTIASVIGIITAGVFGLYVGTVTAGALVTIATIIYLRKSFNLPFYERAASFIAELRRSPNVVPFSFMLYLGALTYSLSFLAVRYAVLKHYGEANAGLLQAALALSLAIGLALNPANGLYLTPIMNRNIEKEEKTKAAIEFEKKLAIILGLVSMPIVLFPHLMLVILFSTKFTVAGQFVFLFVLSQCIAQLAGVHQALLIGFDDLKAYSIMTCAGHISLGLLSWFLVPRFGIFGVAIAFITAYSIIFLSTYARLRMKHGFHFSWDLSSQVGYGLIVLLAAGVISNRFAEWDVAVIVFKVIFYALFAFSFLFFFLSKEERASFFGMWNRVLQRIG